MEQKVVILRTRPLLDEWDFRLIQLFKRGQKTKPEEVLPIWSKRCEVKEPYLHLNDVVRHLVVLANKLNLFSERHYQFEQFIFSLQPTENWRFGLAPEITNYNEILLSRLESLFAHTESDRLPGYRAWIDAQDKMIAAAAEY